MESVHDLDALRRHLGADKISLWGISHGAHLVRAAIKLADADNHQPLADVVQRYFSPGAPLKMQAMPLAMDVASGISNQRLALVEAQATTALLGDTLNVPMAQLMPAPKNAPAAPKT